MFPSANGVEDFIKPKNPTLYNLLSSKFRVRIANQGQSFYGSVRDTGSWRPPGSPADNFQQVSYHTEESGEYYCICCPYCNDTRFRLWINYRWDWNLNHKDTSRLIVCYNTIHSSRPCMGIRDNLLNFRDAYLKGTLAESRVEENYKEVLEETVARIVSPPSIVFPINKLDYGHPASRFLQDRGYSLDILADYFGVGYCPVLRDPGLTQMSNRIYIPVTVAGALIGYQGRVPYEYDKNLHRDLTKYWNLPGFPKTKFLYNEDLASHFETIVICEGATSVWKVGCNAVATLGKTISAQQMMALGRWSAAGKYCVLYFDSDVKDEDLRLFTLRLESMFPKRFVVARLNYGSNQDPGGMTYHENVQFIRSSAISAGIQLPGYG